MSTMNNSKLSIYTSLMASAIDLVPGRWLKMSSGIRLKTYSVLSSNVFSINVFLANIPLASFAL